jgi:hypothetical protein
MAQTCRVSSGAPATTLIRFCAARSRATSRRAADQVRSRHQPDHGEDARLVFMACVSLRGLARMHTLLRRQTTRFSKERHHRRLSPGRRVHRPDSQGREARRPTGHPVDQIRVRDQPQHRQGIRPHHSAERARYCRRGYRIAVQSRAVCCTHKGRGYLSPLPHSQYCPLGSRPSMNCPYMLPVESQLRLM